MPTPFTHLRLVAPLIKTAEHHFPSGVKELLLTQPGPYLLGSTAPDVRNVGMLTRRETHFYPIPPDPNRPSMQTMLDEWPQLANPGRLPPEQAAFVAGYIAHLWFDEFWHQRIITPYYLDNGDWGTVCARFDVYNILLGYMDMRDKNALDDSVGRLLHSTQPCGWLPFVPDGDLLAWRDYLAEQLQPLATTHTASILAERAHMEPADFVRLITDEEEMQRVVFVRTPQEAIAQAYHDGRAGTVEITTRYLHLDE